MRYDFAVFFRKSLEMFAMWGFFWREKEAIRLFFLEIEPVDCYNKVL